MLECCARTDFGPGAVVLLSLAQHQVAKLVDGKLMQMKGFHQSQSGNLALSIYFVSCDRKHVAD